MKELITSRLISRKQLEISVHKDYTSQICKHFYLYEDGVFLKELHIASTSQTMHHIRYFVNNLPTFSLSKVYEIQDDKCLFSTIDCSVLMRDGFNNERYYYAGEMGAIYSLSHTKFVLFAPSASEVYVQLFSKKGKEIHLMKRNDSNGIFTYNAIGDFDGFEYLYLLKINGKYIEAVDPYALSLTVNGKRGVIINKNKFDIDFHDDKLPPLNSEVNSIIYEMSIRDFTSSLHTNIKNKAKFSALSEENRVSENNHPVGLDYLKYLGVSHVQLLPVTDFYTTNELFPEITYNWGYDPRIMFSLKGSYANDVNNPYQRIYEFKNMVASLHEQGIRVIMDMVFNHQFCLEHSSFEKIVPNYYFRFNDDGTLSNGSFCGNELESRHLMVRKYIVDCCLMYVKEFHIDGFRFDLMGLTDQETVLEVYQKCKKINPDFMLYGEGWDMPSSLPQKDKTTLNNAHQLKDIGFFNDRYREIVKGKSADHELGFKGYLLGDSNYFDSFIHCFLASTLPISMPPLFVEPKQSINYIECHDNATIYDKLLISNGNESEKDRLKRISLLNATLIFSYGVCFLHSGQEIGLSKKGVYNSYNAPDEINGFDVEVLDKRFDMAKFVSEAIALKKKYPFFNYASREEIKENVKYENYYNRAIFTLVNQEPFKEVKIIINPLNEPIQLSLDSYYSVIFNEYGNIKDYYAQNLTINGISLVIIVKE